MLCCAVLCLLDDERPRLAPYTRHGECEIPRDALDVEATMLSALTHTSDPDCALGFPRQSSLTSQLTVADHRRDALGTLQLAEAVVSTLDIPCHGDSKHERERAGALAASATRRALAQLGFSSLSSALSKGASIAPKVSVTILRLRLARGFGVIFRVCTACVHVCACECICVLSAFVCECVSVCASVSVRV